MTAATASARGRYSREKGATAERHLVTWLRDHGWPGAERAIRTGYRTNDRTAVDPGDVTGTPGLVWQVKNRTDFDEPAVFAVCLAETEQQRVGADADFGLLVQRRPGYRNPSAWWVWLPLADLHALCGTNDQRADLRAAVGVAPVRLDLGALVPLLWGCGYGTAPATEVAS